MLSGLSGGVDKRVSELLVKLNTLYIGVTEDLLARIQCDRAFAASDTVIENALDTSDANTAFSVVSLVEV